MSYQPVRGLYQKRTYDALVAAGVGTDHVYFDNYGETPPDASQTYALVSLTFGATVEDNIGCEGSERLRGTLQVNLYVPKQQGSKPGEDIALEVIKAWNGMNKRTFDPTPLLSAHTISMEGPLTLGPTPQPHHAVVCSCSFIARV